MSRETSNESPSEFHRHMVNTLLHEWRAMPGVRLEDSDYKESGQRFADKDRNKFRRAWFNAISQEVHLIVEDGLVVNSEFASALLAEVRALAKDVLALRGDVTTELVERGDSLLESVSEAIHSVH